MSHTKLFAFHAEGDTIQELAKEVQAGLAKMGATDAAPAPAPKGKAAAPAPAPSGPKVELADVMTALTALKTGVGGDDDEAKKGLAAVKRVLKKFGVTVSKDLKADQYAEVIAAAKAATPEEGAEEEEM